MSIKSRIFVSQTDYLNASGKIAYNMTNDYMFRAVLQSEKTALKHLICALLHLNPATIEEVEITNPIMLGDTILDKEFHLDIHTRLSDGTRINLEMQTYSKGTWADRSLSYLSREYDDLTKGSDYTGVQSVYQIGFVTFTLFEKNPEFYASYRMKNVRDNSLFSDKFTLAVVNLRRIDLATEEDRRYRIDRWASLFTAGTWEEVKMIAEKDEGLTSAAKALLYYNSDEYIRERCRAVSDYYGDMRILNRKLSESYAALADRDAAIADKDAEITRLRQIMKENGISDPSRTE